MIPQNVNSIAQFIILGVQVNILSARLNKSIPQYNNLVDLYIILSAQVILWFADK